MKHFSPLLFSLSLTLACNAALAQRQITTPVLADELELPEKTSDYTFLVDSLLANVNKANVPSGILYDRVLANAALHDLQTTDITTGQYLFQAYSELRTAAYSKKLFPYTRTGLRAAADKQLRAGLVPIGSLDYEFAVIDTLAEDKRSFIQEGGLYYDGDSGHSPYEKRHATLAALLTDTVNSNTVLSLTNAFQLGNTGRNITHVDVSGPGINVSIPYKGTANVTFSREGWQQLTIRLHFNDGSSATSNSEVFVKYEVASRAVIEEIPAFTGLHWTDYEGRSTYGVGVAAKYFLHPVSKSDLKLRKVIVVIDGFDPTDDRKIPNLATQFDPLLSALESTSGQERDVVFLNLPTTDRNTITNGVNRMEEIRGGADYIERNALVLVELLNRLKPMMADPTEKITILGPSMGGLISRYALALMEKNYADASNPFTYQQPYWLHNTDTWISFDAPHGGANVPKGDQYFVDYFSGVSEAAEYNLSRLNSVAARQMLVHHNLNLKSSAANSFHTLFMRSMNDNGLPGSMGFPQQARRVGIANGRSNGMLNAALGSYGQTGVQLDVVHKGNHKKRQFFYRSTAGGTQIAANMYFDGGPGQKTRVFNGEARVIVGIARPVAKRAKVDFISGPQGSYDLAPGGTFNSQFEIYDKTIKGKQLPGYEYQFSNIRPDHSFIPTVSALAFQYRSLSNYQGFQQLPNPYTDLLSRSMICNDETPFDAIYSPFSTNTGHVTLEVNSQQFLTRELFNISQPPVFDQMVGTTVCENGTVTLNLKDCTPRGAGVSYAWTISGPGVFASTGTTSAPAGGISQTIRNTGGTGTISVSVVATRAGASPSPASVYRLDVTTTGRLYVDLDNNAAACQGDVRTMTVFGAPGPYTWTKAIYNGFQVVSSSVVAVTAGNTLTVTLNDPSHYYAQTSTTCDGQPIYSAPWRFLFDMCGRKAQEVYPNPADQYVELDSRLSAGGTMQLTSHDAPVARKASSESFAVEVFNNRGLLVKKTTSPDGHVRLSTADLPAGFYHVTMKRGNEIIRRNLSVQH